MTTAGPLYGTATDYGSGNPGGGFTTGDVAWTTPANADALDGVFATCSLTSSNDNSNVAEVTGLGFSIPTGATINGIAVTITGKVSSTVHSGTDCLQLLKGGSPTGAGKTGTWIAGTTSNASFTEGSSTDLWSGSFAASDINSSNFGVAYQQQTAGGNCTVSIDAISVTVYYTGGSSAAPAGMAPLFNQTVSLAPLFNSSVPLVPFNSSY